MSIWDDTVTFATGGAGAGTEFWSTGHAEWDSTVREPICCVRDGRYSEVVKRAGWFFPLKVEMRFEGVPSGRGPFKKDDFRMSYASTLAGVEGPEPMPPTGEFSYAPW